MGLSKTTMMTTDHRTEIAVVGGGLAGGLIALALRRRHPNMQVMLIEAQEQLGGNHRWSWFDSDLNAAGTELLTHFRKSEWQGYDVHFPAYSRELPSPYWSLASADFDAALRRELGQSTVYTEHSIASLNEHGVRLSNGTWISARTVIDCRGLGTSRHLTGGWQVFMGRLTHTDKPHGMDKPIIMDARVDQDDVYRFVYVLPVGSNEIFVEDTYYQKTPVLDRNALSSRLDQYHAQNGWNGTILGGETGILPVITGGDFSAFQAENRIRGVGRAGARGGFAHPLTSYTLPFAVETALAIAENAELTGKQLAEFLETRARQHWSKTKFYRRLGAMLFGAAKPEEGYRVFERFYRMNETRIERFYAGQSGFSDKARVLIGKPPVPIIKAIGALMGKGTPLVAHEAHIG